MNEVPNPPEEPLLQMKDELLRPPQRDITPNVQIENVIENIQLEESEFFKNAKRVVNCFAGRALESTMFLEAMTSSRGVSDDQDFRVVAVDRVGPSEEEEEQLPGDKAHFEYVSADVLDYLRSVEPQSLDAITAFGGDAYLAIVNETDPDSTGPYIKVINKRRMDFYQAVKHSIKIGGFLFIPPDQGTFFLNYDEERLFELKGQVIRRVK